LVRASGCGQSPKKAEENPAQRIQRQTKLKITLGYTLKKRAYAYIKNPKADSYGYIQMHGIIWINPFKDMHWIFRIAILA
jgi:hypothetical protein